MLSSSLWSTTQNSSHLLGKQFCILYLQLSDDVESMAVHAQPSEEQEDGQEDTGSTLLPGMGC